MSNNFEHCHVYTTDFLSSKIKFIHTSTVTRSHSCYGKNYKTTRTPRVRLAYIFFTHYRQQCVSRISFRRGGVQNIFWKSRGIYMARTRLLGGFGGMLPKKFLKSGAIWCVLENILLKCCKKNCKNIHFYMKIIENVLLLTLYI